MPSSIAVDFAEWFYRTALDAFFHEKFNTSLEEHQTGLYQRIHRDNNERPHRGSRSMGRRPIETIETGKLNREQHDMKAAAFNLTSERN